MGQQTIAIDFDGVIHRYSKGWQDGSIYDPPVDGAMQALWQLMNNYNVVIFTAREHLSPVGDWIIKHIHKCESLKGLPLKIDNLTVTNRKPVAKVYIDDRAIKFINWNDTWNELEKILITTSRQQPKDSVIND